ncbi:enoyl-CoA hydratase/isomerase family protein [Streptomyces sp. NPDC056468]|uniref:enoyl-CoA hydratase/isomerase family protein n=1 Tax=Streptomyces sp. NPDC056468 TaxID=3345830 RepID=UPI0036A915D9
MTELFSEGAPLKLAMDGPLAVLTMDSPPKNLFDIAMWDAWKAALEWLGDNPPRGLLIRASGTVVSAGVDVEVFRRMARDEAESFWAEQLATTRALERLPFPTVFAAHSLTLTAAFELALACDLIVATGSARFGLVERVVGFTPAMGGTQRLAALAGPARARELVMTGKLYRATTLERWGVVNQIFELATFQNDAHAYAMDLATGPTVAHAATKQVVAHYLAGGTEAADAALPGIAAAVTRSEDHRRSVEAFLTEGPDHATDCHGR